MKIPAKIIILAAALFLNACAPALPALPPNDIVMRSGQAMLQVPSMHFKVEISGAPVVINQATLTSLRSVEGDFARPDRMGVHLKVIVAVAAAEMDMIALGNDQFITNVFTQKWEVLPPQFGFNPAIMFDPKDGLEQTLKSGLDNAQLIGVDTIDGAAAYHVKGSLDGSRVQVMSGGLLGRGQIDVELWADGTTFQTLKAILTDRDSDPKDPSVWTLTFGSFGKPVNITAPTLGQ
ncbi:MAG TPA: LppX_LprAFG lipoprotein [Anaerolineae bacterium]|nr:LppX_LprAFG lipoprotein [Anaerolineae bacterium]